MLSNKNQNHQPIVGVSACLAGEKVRYDGGDKLHDALFKTLSPHATLKPFCPEVAAGFGVPRSPIGLQTSSRSTMADFKARAVVMTGKEAGKDVSDEITKVAVQFLNDLDFQPLCGFVFKSRSPSCGLGSTSIHLIRHAKQTVPGTKDRTDEAGNGLFANVISNQASQVICVEESWLTTAARHYQFLSACYLVFYYFYRGPVDSRLLSLLNITDEDLANPKKMFGHIKKLIAKNTKVAHLERLCDFWTSRIGNDSRDS